MRTPGGARDALASDAQHADGEHDDDPKLRALRAVWLEMRDEEPSDRGLADLLAAAREKADTMQVRPALWQRLVAGLRRPPVLALATVMVLVGGAVVLGRHGLDGSEAIRAPGSAPGSADRMAVAPVVRPAAPVGGPGADGYVAKPASVNGRGAPEAGLVTAGPGDAVGAPEAGLVTAAPARAPAAPGRRLAKEDPASAREPSDKLERAPTPPAGRPGETAPAPRGTDTKAADQLMASDDGVSPSYPQHAPAPEAASKNASRDARPAEANRPQASVADDEGARRPAPGDRPPPDAARSTKDVEHAEASAGASDRPQAPPAVPLAQLYKQCESAARRGDCAAVRLMVGRITKTDRSYRARVEKDSPVARCLAE